MSGAFPAQAGTQIDCNPPSTAVAATTASLSNANAESELADDVQQILDQLAAMEPSAAEQVVNDAVAEAAAKVASKITLAISTEMSLAPISPTSETVSPTYVDPNAITAELPVLNFEPPKAENRSGLSGSFRRQNSGEHKMSHWKNKKSTSSGSWDSRVELGLQAYENNSKYSSFDDCPSPIDELPDGCSFIEMDTQEELPVIESETFGTGHVKMITNYDNQGAGIRRLSSMRDSFKMLECRNEDETVKHVEPSNSYDAFNSFVSYKSTDSVETQEPVTEVADEALADVFAESFADLLAECYSAAEAYEDLTDRFDTTIEMDKPVISFAPEQPEHSVVEGYAGNFSVTVAESLAASDLDEIANHIHEQMCFDPKSFVPQTIDGEPIEAVCVFSSEKLSFKAAETIRTNLESMFALDLLAQVDEVEEARESEFGVENVTIVSIEDCETLEIAAVGGKPSRQKAKGTARSKKTQTRREKRNKKRTPVVNG